MQIFIETLAGLGIMLNVEPNDTIKMIKAKIKKAAGISPCTQRLIYLGTRLEDEYTLSDYGIQRDSTIHCILRLSGS